MSDILLLLLCNTTNTLDSKERIFKYCWILNQKRTQLPLLFMLITDYIILYNNDSSIKKIYSPLLALYFNFLWTTSHLIKKDEGLMWKTLSNIYPRPEPPSPPQCSPCYHNLIRLTSLAERQLHHPAYILDLSCGKGELVNLSMWLGTKTAWYINYNP